MKENKVNAFTYLNIKQPPIRAFKSAYQTYLLHIPTNNLIYYLYYMANQLPEVWLRGPLPEVPALLQPVAHALLQAREEINTLMADFDEELLWKSPAGLASTGFHLQHLTGVLDRLFTYAQGKMLTPEQLDALHWEGKSLPATDLVSVLLNNFNLQVDRAIEQLKAESPQVLTEVRGVGRAQTPSTVIGLYTHAAEHTMRHVGQLLVTVKVLQAGLY